MLEFRPAIARPASLIEFPRPILTLRVLDSWDFETMKVPLRDGDQIKGHSRDGVAISLEGQIGSHSGALKLSEPEMLATLDTIRDAVDVSQNSGQYSLILYEEPQSSQYRYFQSCTTSRFEFDLSVQNLYTYAVTIHASDPEFYSGALPA